MIAQTLTAGLSDAVESTIGWPGLGAIGGMIVAALLAYARGVRLLNPVVAGIDWFRRDGARGFDLSRYGLSADLQEQIRADLQLYLWASLRDAIASLADKLGLLKALDKRVQAITFPLKVLAAKEGAPVTLDEKASAVRRTTGLMAAFRPSDDPPPPPRLGALMLVLALILLGSGCISQAARDLAVTHEAHLIAFDGASEPSITYAVDDADMLTFAAVLEKVAESADGPAKSRLVNDAKALRRAAAALAESGAEPMTAAEKIAAWKAARREVLASARALAEALK